ncbi:MAG: acyl-CoA reductase [Bdellovibrionota bacterium]
MSKFHWEKKFKEFKTNIAPAVGLDNLLFLFDNPLSSPSARPGFYIEGEEDKAGVGSKPKRGKQQISPQSFRLPMLPKIEQNEADAESRLKKNQNFYLPIEALRYESKQLFEMGQKAAYKTDPFKTFLSSGTTQAERAQSHFSKLGLELYKFASIACFIDVLSQTADTGTHDVWSMQGFSLVPPIGVWESSSLAQMIGWISEFLLLQYVNEDNIDAAIKRVLTPSTSHQPVWIFATALHLLSFIEKNRTLLLPKGSIIIETGGSKGRFKSLVKKELYKKICACFGITERQIISEYGMCELASQAYDFVPFKDLSEKERVFRFPSWVSLATTQGLDHFEEYGEGSLLIKDPLRIDCPWPIRTQDIASLKEDGTFKLKGRVPGATLKGCSLLAEQVLESKHIKSNNAGSSRSNLISEKQSHRNSVPEKLDGDKLEWIAKYFPKFVGSQDFYNSLVGEFGSDAIAVMVIDSLLACLPNDLPAWRDAVDKSNGLNAPRSCLLILPNNHSIVGLYPIVFSFLCGIELHLRIPEKFAHSSSTIKQLLQFLGSYQSHCPSNKISLLNSDYRLGVDQVGGNSQDLFSAVIVYGSDETVSAIRQIFPGRVQGFGSQIVVTLLAKEDANLLSQLSQDILNLKQLGCLSTRAVFIDGWNEEEIFLFQKAFTLYTRKILAPALTVEEKTALDCASCELVRCGIPFYKREYNYDPVLPVYDYRETSMATFSRKTVTSYLANLVGIIPLINLDHNFYNIKELLKKVNGLNISYSPHAQAVADSEFSFLSKNSIKKLGFSHFNVWDGSHQGLPLFSFS